MAGVAEEPTGTAALDPVGEDAEFQIEYIEEEMEEEPFTDDEAVEVAVHDQTPDVLKSVAKPHASLPAKPEEPPASSPAKPEEPPASLQAKPEEPPTPEDCKKEFVKGTFQDWYLNHWTSNSVFFLTSPMSNTGRTPSLL